MTSEYNKPAMCDFRRVVKASNLSASESNLFKSLYFYFDTDTVECFPSQEELMSFTSMTKITLRKATKALVDKGLITVEAGKPWSKIPQERSNRYRLNMEVFTSVSLSQVPDTPADLLAKYRNGLTLTQGDAILILSDIANLEMSSDECYQISEIADPITQQQVRGGLPF